MRTALPVLALLGVLSLSARAADPDKLMEKRTFKKDKATLPYRLMKPEGYDKSKSYPLVIFLHGAGERGDDNAKQLKHGVKSFASDDARKKHPCFLLAPQCPTTSGWAARPGKGKAAASEGSLALVLGAVEELQKEYTIDDKRIYVTGLSMGGFGTWDLLSRKPEMIAAAVPICGGGNPSKAEVFAKVPIWAFHGAKDPTVKVQLTRDMVEALKKAGGEPKYTEYPEANHDSWTKTYANPEVMDWMFAQKKGG